MIVVGLTGSIGMGKSTAAGLFREAGVPVQDADQVVAELYAQGGAAVGPVGAAFPGVVNDGTIDRAALSQRVLSRPDMNETKLAQILARQTPDSEKRARADFVIDTSGAIAATREQVRAVLDEVRSPRFRSHRSA